MVVAFSGPPPKILIIDAAAALTHFLRDIFMRAGYVVFVAAGESDGLELIKRHGPDLVLLDVSVRRDGAWGSLNRVKQRAGEAAVIVMGSAATEEAQKRAAAWGCAGFVSKELGLEPFLHDLKRLVARILPAPSAKTRPKGRILVVDDDPQIVQMLTRFLTARNFDVISALNGQEALSVVKKERPHLMLLDIDMPVMTGMDVLRTIRETDKEISIIMITGHEDEEVARETMRLGASDYIAKPLNLQYLETTVLGKILMMTA